MTHSPHYASIHALVFRVCLFIFGGDYWIYAYCVLYIYIGTALTWRIAIKRFPFIDDMLDNEQKVQKVRVRVDEAKHPEFVLGYVTCLFAMVIGLMQAI